jgi:hypothetical protein
MPHFNSMNKILPESAQFLIDMHPEILHKKTGILAWIFVSATPRHFWEARQELAGAQTACRASQKRPDAACCHGILAENSKGVFTALRRAALQAVKTPFPKEQNFTVRAETVYSPGY